LQLFEFIHNIGIASEFMAIPPCFPESEVAESLKSASLTRKGEFVAGRIAARKALSPFGITADVIPISINGAPTWPSGSVGSISHSATHACAIASRASRFKSLGVDIEPQSSMSRLTSLRSLFLTETERNFSPLEALITFSAKESLFKMIFSLTREFFGFEAAVVKGFSDHVVNVTLAESVGSFSRGTSFKAFFEFHRGHIVTVCMLAST
jgi:enterobactin synthetase component D